MTLSILLSNGDAIGPDDQEVRNGIIDLLAATEALKYPEVRESMPRDSEGQPRTVMNATTMQCIHRPLMWLHAEHDCNTAHPNLMCCHCSDHVSFKHRFNVLSSRTAHKPDLWHVPAVASTDFLSPKQRSAIPLKNPILLFFRQKRSIPDSRNLIAKHRRGPPVREVLQSTKVSKKPAIITFFHAPYTTFQKERANKHTDP